MADFTLTSTQTFPEGTSVEAYARADFPAWQQPQGAPPAGATPADTATMTDGTVAFTGLEDGTRYVAYADVDDAHRYVSFATPAAVAGAASGASTELGARAAGFYYSPGPVESVSSTGSGDMTAYPLFFGEAVTVDRLGCEVTTAGAGGTVIHLGIFDDDGGYPGARLIDAGTVAGDVVAVAEKTISQVLDPGVYWFAALAIGGSPTVRRVGVSSLAVPVGENWQASQGWTGGVYVSGQAGLPAQFPAGASATPGVTRLFFRLA